ncbi:MAG: hypothetical protein J6Z43_07475 [Clostridiales bacterium]|nr:hypothetical protein [Clostridiales bacterium]
MNEENVKLAKIKKSSSVGKKVSIALCIVCIVGCMIALIAGIVLVTSAERFEPQFAEAVESGEFDTSKNAIGKASMFHIEYIDPSDWESDVPAIKNALENYPYSTVYGVYLMIVGLCIAVAAVMMKLLSSVFAMIEKEDTPFTDKVIKRVTVVMIVISGFLFLTAGSALGILSGLATWVIYTVMDYGKTLQIQSDETL